MGLYKKLVEISKSRIKSEYEIFLLSQYKEKHENGEILEKSRTNAPTLAQKIAFAKSESELKTLLRVRNKLNDKEVKLAYRYLSSDEAINNSPNYFLTLAMDSCFDKKWNKYDRNNKTKKLYRSSLILLKKLLPMINPVLKNKPYEEWPFFIAVMEHFDDEGNLVAPHMHILFKIDCDIRMLRAAIEDLWGNAVPEAGKNGIDLQYVTSHALPEKARYLFKHAYQDHEFKLDNGPIPEFVCKQYGWSRDAVSHDIWMIRRENFRAALAGKSMTHH